MPITTFSIAADADDGSGWRADTVWANIASGSFFDSSATFDDTRSTAGKYWTGTEFRVPNAFLRFDTSALDDAATISAANLLINVEEIANVDGVSLAADYYDFGGEPPVAADWEQSSSGDCIASFAIASLVDDTVNTLPLTGLAGISKTGITGIRLAPSNTTAPTGFNYIHFGSREHATLQEPRLEVTWEPYRPLDFTKYPRPALRTPS